MKHLPHLLAAGSILLFGLVMVYLDLFVPISITISAPREVRETAIEYGKSLEGRPYRFGENGPDAFDCSGLIIHIFHHAAALQGLSLPFQDATAGELAMQYSRAIHSPDPGDLLFFSNREGEIVHTALVLEMSEESYTILDAASFSGAVEKRSIPRDRSDIHSIARLKMTRIW